MNSISKNYFYSNVLKKVNKAQLSKKKCDMAWDEHEVSRECNLRIVCLDAYHCSTDKRVRCTLSKQAKCVKSTNAFPYSYPRHDLPIVKTNAYLFIADIFECVGNDSNAHVYQIGRCHFKHLLAELLAIFVNFFDSH